MDECFKLDGYEITRLTEKAALALQHFLEQCRGYFDLVEGRPATPAAAVEELSLGPPERVPHDLFCFGIRTSPGKIIGVLTAFRGHRRDRQWYLSFLLIHPALRRRQLGRKAYLAFEGWIRSQQADSLLLAVVETNQGGARFWRRLGFMERRRFPRVRIGLRDHTLIEFEKEIGL